MPNVSIDTPSETLALDCAGAEIVEFSPTDVLGETIPIALGNLRS